MDRRDVWVNRESSPRIQTLMYFVRWAARWCRS